MADPRFLEALHHVAETERLMEELYPGNDVDSDLDIYGRDCDGYSRQESHCMHGYHRECPACDAPELPIPR